MRRRILAVAGGALALAGCQADGGPPPVASTPGATLIAAPAPVAFACPAAGTRVTWNNSLIVTHGGADPADPTVCLVRFQNGPQLRMLYNIYDVPASDEAAIRRGMSALWPLTEGKSASFLFVAPSVAAQTFQYDETWRVVRAERITIAGQPRDTLVLRWTSQGRLGNAHLSHQTWWYDLTTRTFVKREVELVRGTTRWRSAEAVAIGRI